MTKDQALKIIKLYGAKSIKTIPQKIEGGLLHLMWRIETEIGEFAIKELNPEIMHREGLRDEMETSEANARKFKAVGIPAITAILIDEKAICSIDNKDYMIYKWCEGHVLSSAQVRFDEGIKIAKILAKIHGANLESDKVKKTEYYSFSDDDLKRIAQKATEQKASFADILNRNLDKILQWNKEYLNSAKELQKNTVLSHGDLDPKNVIWSKDNECHIIDWESTQYVNPMQEILSVALDWSGATDQNFDKNIFIGILSEYQKSIKNPANYLIKFSAKEFKDAYWGVIGNWLAWLEYNIKRAVGEKADNKKEQALGTIETSKTLKLLLYLTDKNSNYHPSHFANIKGFL